MGKNTYGFVEKNTEEIEGIIRSHYYQNESLVVAEITEELSDMLSTQILDGSEEIPFDYESCMEALQCRFLLLIWNEHEEERLYFFSNSKRIRAVEYLDYLIPGFGLVKGNGTLAGGRISEAILKVQMSDVDITDALTYFLFQSNSYFSDCDCIYAEEYGKEKSNQIMEMPRYVKKQIPWAFVKSTDILEEGKKIHIKSLENESGLEVTVSEDIYIMIGCRGEVYDIKREKFEQTYEVTEQALDIFEQMLDFLPEVQEVETGEFISIDERAHLCYPKAGLGIYAEQLAKRTKIFPRGKEQEYYLGRPGDYMAVRPDDFCDIYVIEGEIFSQTYEMNRR